MSPALSKQDGETGGKGEVLNILAGGIVVGVRGEQQWTKICTQSVLPDVIEGGNRRGRHDELGYRSSAPKASAAQGGRECVREGLK